MGEIRISDMMLLNSNPTWVSPELWNRKNRDQKSHISVPLIYFKNHILFIDNVDSVHSLCRISDRGGGIPHDRVESVMRYNFTTAEESTEALADSGGPFANLMDSGNRTTSGPMHG
jgi:[3-methyl-2-oxobutanoate dehydrogenase (acetyl-transferring)] kinase